MASLSFFGNVEKMTHFTQSPWNEWKECDFGHILFPLIVCFGGALQASKKFPCSLFLALFFIAHTGAQSTYLRPNLGCCSSQQAEDGAIGQPVLYRVNFLHSLNGQSGQTEDLHHVLNVLPLEESPLDAKAPESKSSTEEPLSKSD